MSRPVNKENLMSLADQLLWGMQQYGVSTELFGATAYVGFNEALEPKVNYFLCDGTADNVQVQEAVDYITGLGLAGKPKLNIVGGTFSFIATVDVPSNITLDVKGRIEKGFAGSPFTIQGTDPTHITDVDIIGGTYDGNDATYNDANPFFYLDYADRINFRGCNFIDVYNYGVGTAANTCTYITVTDCYGEDNYGLVILDMVDHFIISDNVSMDSHIDIRVSGSHNGVIDGNLCCDGAGGGAITVIATSDNISVTGNVAYNKPQEAYELAQAHNCSLIGNVAYLCLQGGAKCWDISYCKISENYFFDCACSAAGGDMPVSAQISIFTADGAHESYYNIVKDNYLYSSGTEAPNVLYGLGEDESGGGDVDYNTYKNNVCIGHATAPGVFVGENNVYESFQSEFAGGTSPQASGCLINAGGNQAWCHPFIPRRVQQIIRMKMYARSGVLEADSMNVELVVRAGADNEPYATHAVAVNPWVSTSVNFAADDVIHWTTIDAGLLAMGALDSLEVIVLHAAAGNGDCATNAYVRTAEFEYI